ncbi:MAG: 50S ribosomal protein L11 methyltransferase [Xanthomonadaceae bacterium]|nr:50S ribosomal protein L11 methyltransferase [Xanthomonadaceae bacterium]
MPWTQLTLEAGDQDPEQLSDFLLAAGAGSVTFLDAADQPIFEPDPGDTPLWTDTRVVALFDDPIRCAEAREALAERFGAGTAARVQVETLEDRDWERAWMDYFQPMRFGQHLWVVPTGMAAPVDEQAVVLDLDPGLAFGTGTHPTTAQCLAWLDGHPPSGQQVLDFGCGSGILAIAALKLGAAHAWGTDIDDQALWASRENAARNGVAERLALCRPEDLPADPVDMLLANILAEQAQAVMAAYEPWIRFDPVLEQDGWVCLAGEKRNPAG